MQECTIILVDDHALYREGVRKVLEESKLSLPVIAECANARELFDALENGNAPDLILLDIILPDMSGIEIASHLKTNYPRIKIIMLSSEVSPDFVEELLAIDVEGYLSKLARKEDLEKAIRSVINGDHFYGESVAKIIRDIYVVKKNEVQPHRRFRGSREKEILTAREEEIVSLLCEGLQAKEVADKLEVSPRTVETHKANILKKLGFNNMIELVRYAFKMGIVEL